jgi:insulysin
MEDVLSCMYLFSEWKPDIIETIWKDFVPEKIRIVVLAKQYESELNQVEPWYGTKYKVAKLPEEVLEKWRNAGLSDDLKMPEKNEFIPTDFQLYPIDKDITEHPSIIQDTALTRVWFKQDETFLLPKANVMFDFVRYHAIYYSTTFSTAFSFQSFGLLGPSQLQSNPHVGATVSRRPERVRLRG